MFCYGPYLQSVALVGAIAWMIKGHSNYGVLAQNNSAPKWVDHLPPLFAHAVPFVPAPFFCRCFIFSYPALLCVESYAYKASHTKLRIQSFAYKASLCTYVRTRIQPRTQPFCFCVQSFAL